MRMRIRMLLGVAGLAMALGTSSDPLDAQQQRRRTPAERDSLEQEVRQRVAKIMKEQLDLTDAQMQKLLESNRRFEGRRRELVQQERQLRSDLRREMRAKDSTRNPAIAVLLDRMLELQQQRLDLLKAEQADLATFMTPLQRARHFGMEEQIRRRLSDMRERRRDDRDRRPDRGGDRGGRDPDDREHDHDRR
ncbi:MAG TPA: hypothetical protein VFM71_12510 [Gemmatimonadaceae bacterium]|nr:hypothetical protein [Gemmatimonadaceae bacterium]